MGKLAYFSDFYPLFSLPCSYSSIFSRKCVILDGVEPIDAQFRLPGIYVFSTRRKPFFIWFQSHRSSVKIRLPEWYLLKFFVKLSWFYRSCCGKNRLVGSASLPKRIGYHNQDLGTTIVETGFIAANATAEGRQISGFLAQGFFLETKVICLNPDNLDCLEGEFPYFRSGCWDS